MSSSIVIKMLSKQRQLQQQAAATSKSAAAGNLQKRVVARVGSTRRIFTPVFKLKVLHSYKNDIDCRMNQRATARKYKIHRRQIQKWLQIEENLRNSLTSAAADSACSEDASNIVGTPTPSPMMVKGNPVMVVVPQPQQQAVGASADSNAAAGAATPASPALNLRPARLHGDELAVQQPPPPRPPPSAAAAAAAAQALAAAAAQQYQHQTSYRFHQQPHHPSANVVPTSTSSYPAHALSQFSSSSTPYPMHLYPQQLVAAYHRHQASQPTSYDHLHRGSAFQPTSYNSSVPTTPNAVVTAVEHQRKIVESAALSPASTVSSLLSPRSPPNAMDQCPSIKTERVTTPGPYHQQTTPITTVFKKEKYQNDEFQSEYRRTSVSNSSSGVSELSCSPAPSHVSAECPSPMDSSELGSDSEMDMSPGGATRIRRSYSVRFKLDVLDAYYKDASVAGNQRATARNFGINRRQVQKWLKQEQELRGVIELSGNNNRQRLGPSQESTETPVDLRTSPPYVASLTPPYSAPGCAMSCCQDGSPIGTMANSQSTYYCYSPMEVDCNNSNSTTNSQLEKQANCSEQCCNPAKKEMVQRLIHEAKEQQQKHQLQQQQQQQQEQETPLCLVKPREEATASSLPPPAIAANSSTTSRQVKPVGSSSVPSPPTASSNSSSSGAILFKPYLDNVLSRPTSNGTKDTSSSDHNDNKMSTTPSGPSSSSAAPWNHHQYNNHLYLDEYSQVKSAFIRYPSANAHYS